MNWTSNLVTGAGLWDQLDRFDDLNEYVQNRTTELSDRAIAGSRFVPFGVAGYGGGASVSGTGDVSVNMDPAQQAQADQLTASANNFFASAGADTSAREASIFDRIRAMQRPGEERAMLDLEARALGQGRLGLSSDAYGGASPEMLALQTAIAEGRNNAAVSAIGEARAQQMQDANIGLNFQNAAFLPQANLLNLINPALQAANMGQAGQLGGMNLATQLGLGGIQSQINSERIRADILAGLYGGVGSAISGSGVDPIGDIIGKIFGGS
jgi:hypothetical protein